MKTFIIINPAAAGGRSLQRWIEIEKTFIKGGIEFEKAFTQKPGHAKEYVATAMRKGYKRIAACGGDGTLHEVVNGAFNKTPNIIGNIEFIFIPTGTSCDFEKDLPSKTPIERMQSNVTEYFDIIEIKNLENDKRVKKEYCLNSCNIGIIAEAANIINARNSYAHLLKKHTSVNFLIITAAIHAILKSPPIKCGSMHGVTFMSLTLSKTQWISGGMKMDVEAGRCDGKMNLVIMDKSSALKTFFILPKLFNGKCSMSDKIHMSKCTNVEIITETPRIIEADGEIIGVTPAFFKILPRRLRIVV